MRNRFLLLAMACVASVACSALAVPPPDNPSKDKATNVKDSVIATMDEVDDIGFLFLWNGDPNIQKIGQCEWAPKFPGGQDGSTSVNVHDKLNKGTNYLVFVLYNQIFEGPFGGGKWSYSFKLKKNQDTVWQKSDRVDNNTAEIKYWKVFKLDVGADGSVATSEDIPKEEMDVLTKFVTTLETKLVETCPKRTVKLGQVVGEALKNF